MSRRPRACTLALLALCFARSGGGAAAATVPPGGLPPVRHVFVLLLENQSYAVTFGRDSQAPYLARTLPARVKRSRAAHGPG